MRLTHLGGFGAKQSVPQGRAARPVDVVLSRARIYGYGRSLRPCHGTTIAPLRRAVSRQTLLAFANGDRHAAKGAHAALVVGELDIPDPGRAAAVTAAGDGMDR